jgi:hypothetical protein
MKNLLYIFLCISLNMHAMQKEETSAKKKPEIPVTLSIVESYLRARLIRFNDLTNLAKDSHTRGIGEFLNTLRTYYHEHKPGFFKYFKPVVNGHKSLAYFHFIKEFYQSRSDLSFKEAEKIYWPTISMHIDFRYLADSLMHEIAYLRKILHESNFDCINSMQLNIRKKILEDLDCQVSRSLSETNRSINLTAITQMPVIIQESLKSDSLIYLSCALHCIDYKNALSKLNSFKPMQEIDDFCRLKNKGNGLFHFIIDEYLPPILFTSVAAIFKKDFNLDVNKPNYKCETPLAYAASKPNISGIIVGCIKDLGGVLKIDKHEKK